MHIMKEMTDIELKKASILDFTDDISLIRKCMDCEGLTLEMLKESDSAEEKMLSLLNFAEYTNNEPLLRRLESVFENEMSALFNE